ARWRRRSRVEAVDRDPRAFLSAARRRAVDRGHSRRAERRARPRLERAHRAGMLRPRGSVARGHELRFRDHAARVDGAARARDACGRRRRQSLGWRGRHAVPSSHPAVEPPPRQTHRGAVGHRRLQAPVRARPRGHVAARNGRRRRGDVRVESFGTFLARQEPEEDVRLVAPSSWSCPHGVERWRAECGCRAAPERGLHQRWRAPLRAALEWLAAELRAPYERDGRPLPHELERHALRMFTSSGWFFDDIAGIESVIVLRSAARAIELSGPPSEAARLEAGLLERLALAPSNDPAVGSGRELYLTRVKR